MSASTTDAIAAAAADSAQADADAAAAVAAEAAAAATPTPTAEETAAAEAAAAEAAAAPPKPDPVSKRIANLNRKAADSDRAREAAERRAEAAEALLAASKAEDPEKPLTPPASRQAPAPDRETLRAEIKFNDRLAEIDASGKRDLGADQWEMAKATMTEFDAVKNMPFLQALAETENSARIFAALADDTDALSELLRKSPAAMAAKLGRMDAEMSKPAPKPLSAAPKPGARVDAGGVLPVTDIYDPKISIADLDKELDRLLPVHLGGKRRAVA